MKPFKVLSLKLSHFIIHLEMAIDQHSFASEYEIIPYVVPKL